MRLAASHTVRLTASVCFQRRVPLGASSRERHSTKSVERKQVGGGKAGVGERIRLVRGEAEAR